MAKSLREIGAEVSAAFDRVQIPEALEAEYGQFNIWKGDDSFVRYVYRFNTVIDRVAVWIVATEPDGSRTMVGIAFSPTFFSDLWLLFQTAVDQWPRLCHPVNEGDMMPEPRGLYFEKDEEGRVNAVRQSVALSTSLSWNSLVYFYDRSKYRIERVPEMCSKDQEAFRLVEIGKVNE